MSVGAGRDDRTEVAWRQRQLTSLFATGPGPPGVPRDGAEVMVRPCLTIRGEAELERTREIMEGAEARCFISNSVKAKVKVIAKFVVAPLPK